MAENGEAGPGGDDAMLVALATGATLDEAAAAAGCSPRTVSRRLADRRFVRRVSTLRGQLFDAATGRLANNAALAADKLVALLNSPQDHVAYAAAKSILELGTKLREAGELEQRIAALEGAPGDDEGEHDAALIEGAAIEGRATEQDEGKNDDPQDQGDEAGNDAA